jgi:hypothetical protein
MKKVLVISTITVTGLLVLSWLAKKTKVERAPSMFMKDGVVVKS